MSPGVKDHFRSILTPGPLCAAVKEASDGSIDVTKAGDIHPVSDSATSANGFGPSPIRSAMPNNIIIGSLDMPTTSTHVTNTGSEVKSSSEFKFGSEYQWSCESDIESSVEQKTDRSQLDSPKIPGSSSNRRNNEGKLFDRINEASYAAASAIESLVSKWRPGNGIWRQKYLTSQQDLVDLKSTDSELCQVTEIASFESKIEKLQAEIARGQGPNIIRHFRPSFSALQNATHPISGQFHGTTVSSERPVQPEDDNQNIPWSEDIPENQNCALWVVGLPAEVTIKTLLDGIRGVGKVAATVVKSADANHPTAAVKIVFFTRRQAQTLLVLATNRCFQVLDRVITAVSWNQVKCGPYPHKEWSRAIKTTGPAEIMDISKLKGWFTNRFNYDLDRVMEVPCMIPGKVSLRWDFGSARCQSAWAKAALERELPGIVKVEWVRDRCE